MEWQPWFLKQNLKHNEKNEKGCQLLIHSQAAVIKIILMILKMTPFHH